MAWFPQFYQAPRATLYFNGREYPLTSWEVSIPSAVSVEQAGQLPTTVITANCHVELARQYRSHAEDELHWHSVYTDREGELPETTDCPYCQGVVRNLSDFLDHEPCPLCDDTGRAQISR